MQRTVENVLRQVEDQAAMLRFLFDNTADSDAWPDPATQSGVADVIEETPCANNE